MGACLLRFAPQWHAITADSWVRNVVVKGYSLPFKTRPPLSSSPVDIQLPADPERCVILDTEVHTMLVKGAIEPVANPWSPGFYSHIFLVPKKNGKWRPVIDLSSLNVHVRCPTFRMETSALVRAALQEGEWATSLDLSDAYFHIPIHTGSRRFLRFKHRGTVYQFRALPFGLNTAPRVFTRMMSVVMAYLRSACGVVIHPYIDDWLLRASSESDSRRYTDIVLRLCRTLGLNVNLEKSDLTPSQQFSFLGDRYDLQRAWVWPGAHKVQALREAVQVLLDEPVPHARLFLKAVGHMVSVMELIEWGRFHLRAIQWCLAAQWHMGVNSLTAPVAVDRDALSELHWWLRSPEVTLGVPLHPPLPSCHVFTDASEEGWGAGFGDLTISEPWRGGEGVLSSNQRELLAILLAVRSWESLLHGKTLLVATDNTTAIAYINKQGGLHSRPLQDIALELLRLCQRARISIRARHIQGKLNLVADMLSRPDQIFPLEWRIDPTVLRDAFVLWGRPLVDVFATSLNTQLPVYFSPVPDPGAAAVDGLSQDWRGLFLYAFPPFGLLPSVLEKVRMSPGLRMILVAPAWPRCAWYQTLTALAAQRLAFRHHPRLLVQPHSGAPYVTEPVLRLTAWLLLGGH